MSKVSELPYNARVKVWERLKSRPPQAPIDGQFWIVINIDIESATKRGRPKNFYRHTSATLAFAEAERLRDMNEGGAFGVFYCCGICRTTLPSPSASLCAQLPPQSDIERTAAAFLKEWLLYVDAVPPSESEAFMTRMANAMWQIREVCAKS